MKGQAGEKSTPTLLKRSHLTQREGERTCWITTSQPDLLITQIKRDPARTPRPNRSAWVSQLLVCRLPDSQRSRMESVPASLLSPCSRRTTDCRR